jgi:hypothetical protein
MASYLEQKKAEAPLSVPAFEAPSSGPKDDEARSRDRRAALEAAWDAGDGGESNATEAMP